MHRTLDHATLNAYAEKLKTFAKVSVLAMLLIFAVAFAAPAQSQTLTFTVETSTSGGTAVVPRLTWTTAPAGAQCTASTTPAAVPPATDPWSGAQASSGTKLLPAINATRSYGLVCNWAGNLTAVVSWQAPTTNSDGSALTNLTGYRIQYGRTNNEAGLDTSAYTSTPAVTTWTSPTLAAGQWYFGVKAVNAQGLESVLSNIGGKLLTAGSSQTRTLEVVVRFPNAPTGVTVE